MRWRPVHDRVLGAIVAGIPVGKRAVAARDDSNDSDHELGFFPVDNGDGSTETASDEDVASAGRAVRARKPPPEFNRVDWVEFMDMRHASITQRAAPR